MFAGPYLIRARDRCFVQLCTKHSTTDGAEFHLPLSRLAGPLTRLPTLLGSFFRTSTPIQVGTQQSPPPPPQAANHSWAVDEDSQSCSLMEWLDAWGSRRMLSGLLPGLDQCHQRWTPAVCRADIYKQPKDLPPSSISAFNTFRRCLLLLYFFLSLTVSSLSSPFCLCGCFWYLHLFWPLSMYIVSLSQLLMGVKL